MHKVTWFVRFADRESNDASDRRWAEQHGPICLEVPGVLRYVQNRVVTTATLKGAVDADYPFDGIAAMWWADRESCRAAMQSPEWERVLDDSRRLFDAGWTLNGMNAETEERVQRVGPGAVDDGVSTPRARQVKLIGLLRYRTDMTRDEANQWWMGRHTELALKIREIGHYTQNHSIRPAEGSPELRFDGYSESWYADMGTYEQAMASPEWLALNADGDNLFDMSAFESAIVEERVLREFQPRRSADLPGVL